MLGHPCLVRLNPNIPWKTRGNGAVCIQLQLGETSSGNKDSSELISAAERVEQIISAKAALEDPTTNPGLMIIDDQGLPLDLYWSAVREILDLENVKALLDETDAIYRGFKNCRGIIGAAAAVAWGSNVMNNQIQTQLKTPLDHTFELIAYRREGSWGTTREVDLEAVLELDRRFPSTFNNYDHEEKHAAITPNSPCPVLFGIRGDDVGELYDAVKFLAPNSEPIDKWLVFNTNQGTDDHLQKRSLSEIRPNISVITEGNVISKPRTIEGGHVIFTMAEPQQSNQFNQSNQPGSAKIDCAAYEPTKSFRRLVQKVCPGDRIKVYGGVREVPFTINIEKLEILKLTELFEKVSNPKCTNCGKNMKSIGMGKGYRCRMCGTKVPEGSAAQKRIERELTEGIYEVPVGARRHLSKPLKRMDKKMLCKTIDK